MVTNTKIEWADHTFNPWIGCAKVGPGCDNCYAEAQNKRFRGGNWGVNASRRLTSDANWRQPIRWNNKAEASGIRPRVFVASMADVFDKEVPPSWRQRLWQLIVDTPSLDWLIVTKRIGNAPKMLPSDWLSSTPENVWLGATVVNQDEANRDIPKLLQIPSAIHFLSIEPMLGRIELDDLVVNKTDSSEDHFDCLSCDVPPEDDPANGRTIDWVIVGGESGPNARPMHPDWVTQIKHQCEIARVPFFFKQWGEWCPRSPCYHKLKEGNSIADLDPSATKWPCIRLTEDGREYNEVPQ